MGAGKGKSRRVQANVLQKAVAKYGGQWAIRVIPEIEALGKKYRGIFWFPADYGGGLDKKTIMVDPELKSSLLGEADGAKKWETALEAIEKNFEECEISYDYYD